MSNLIKWRQALGVALAVTLSNGLGSQPASRVAAAGTHPLGVGGAALQAGAAHATSWHALPAELAPVARRALTHRAGVATGPRTTTWTQEAELTPSDRIGNLGYAVALSGNTAIMGSPARGAVYVFGRSGSTWSQQSVIIPTDRGTHDLFGTSVAFNGTTIVVGAPAKDRSTGAAYIFVKSGTTWTQQAEVRPIHSAINTAFGFSVALSDNTMVVGTDNAMNMPGAVYAFVRNGNTWIEQTKLVASDGTPNDAFGISVALSANTALVGAPGKNSNTGASYVYVRSGSSWTQQAELTASDGGGGFGKVALSGSTAVIGAFLKGATYVYVRSGSTWSQQAEFLAPSSASDFGWSTAISGATAVVGAYYAASSFGQSGAAYVYVRIGTTWTKQATLLASDGRGKDQFGWAVAVSGNSALIGAPGRTTTYVFVRQ